MDFFSFILGVLSSMAGTIMIDILKALILRKR